MIIVPPPLIIHRPGRYSHMSLEQIERRIAMIDKMQKENEAFAKFIICLVGIPTIIGLGVILYNFWKLT